MASRRKKPRVVLWLGILILFIPCVILCAVLWSSLEDPNQPVEGSRFQDELNPAITQEQLDSIVASMNQYQYIESVEVNCISATVRVLLNTTDTIDEGDLSWMIHDAYAVIDSILPIQTYFTNTETTKMYDLEIHTYNVTSGENKIYYVLTKTGGAQAYGVDVLSSPKNPTVSDSILNPQPVVEESDDTGITE